MNRFKQNFGRLLAVLCIALVFNTVMVCAVISINGARAVISSLVATTFSSTYDTATPAGSDSPTAADDRMREIKAAVQERENVDHYWPLTGTEVSDACTGEHRKVLFHAPIAATPTVAANHGDIRIADVDGKAELFFTDEDEQESQLTQVGETCLGHSTAPRPVMQNTTEEDGDGGRESRIIAKGEQSGGEVTTLGYIQFAHNGAADNEKGKVSIHINDGNDGDAPSKVAITFIEDGTVRPSESISVLDEDDMASDSATRLPTQQSTKAYVDTSIGTWDPTVATQVAAGTVTFGLPNGLVLKIGTTTIAASEANHTVTYAAAFDTGTYAVHFTGNATTAATGQNIWTHTLTAAGFKVNNAANAATIPVAWFAIGY